MNNIINNIINNSSNRLTSTGTRSISTPRLPLRNKSNSPCGKVRSSSSLPTHHSNRHKASKVLPKALPLFPLFHTKPARTTSQHRHQQHQGLLLALLWPLDQPVRPWRGSPALS